MDDRQNTPLIQKRVLTGVGGLDTILGGGLLLGGIYIVSGQPGAGKTILANQICFNHVARGGRALFVTLLAETHGRMLEHMQSLSFFDSAPIAHSLYYVSGFEIMEQDGLVGLLQLIRQGIQTYNATLVVIDGLATVWSLSPSDVTFKRFIQQLQVFIEATGATLLLLSQRDDTHFRAEHTMVDGLIELTNDRVDVRTVRQLQVSKFRGAGYLQGQHVFEITDAGIVVYPRTEALFSTQPREVAQQRRMPFGSASLDMMLHGGLLSASVTTVVGVPGSGKTSLGLHFLTAGAAVGEHGLYFGFYEPPARLLEKAQQIGLDLSAAVEQGMVEIAWGAALEQSIDMIAALILENVRRRQVRRLVIDGMNAFQQAAIYPQRLGRFFAALFNELRALDVTVVITVETPDLFGDHITWPVIGTASIAENVIFLRYVNVQAQLLRLIAILKLRDSTYDMTVRTFSIGNSGVVVDNAFIGAPAAQQWPISQGAPGQTSPTAPEQQASASEAQQQ